ncbi:MAG: hypothetical protein EBS01_05465 [Verrucomicrobia bacterium]|nr:hypothetical protein [Verrucomicrobiota bacterium]
MVFEFLLTAGLLCLSLALRSFNHEFLFRLGNLGILCVSYLLGWLFTGAHAGGVLCVSLWFLFPWIDLLGRVRLLEMPDSHPVEAQAPPGPRRFPDLEDLTEEAELEGFTRVEDLGWEVQGQRHFVRLMVHPETQVRASITLVENEEMSFHYIALRTQTQEGKVFYTWNYPFSMSLITPPHWQVTPFRQADSFLALTAKHRSVLLQKNPGNAAPVPVTLEDLKAEIQNEMRSQVDHNLKRGFLLQCGNGLVRYSLKGCFFLWFQFVKELVRVR